MFKKTNLNSLFYTLLVATIVFAHGSYSKCLNRKTIPNLQQNFNLRPTEQGSDASRNVPQPQKVFISNQAQQNLQPQIQASQARPQLNIRQRGSFQVIKDCNQKYQRRSSRQMISFADGGYKEILNFQSNEEIKVAIAFMQKMLGSKFSLIRIIRIFKQIKNGINYKFYVEIKYTSTVNIKYVIIIRQHVNNSLSIINQYFDIPIFNPRKLRHYSKAQQAPYIKEIYNILNRRYKLQMDIYSLLIQCDVSEPYFDIVFGDYSGSKLKITLIYDIMKDSIVVLNTRETKITLKSISAKQQKVEKDKIQLSSNNVIKVQKQEQKVSDSDSKKQDVDLGSQIKLVQNVKQQKVVQNTYSQIIKTTGESTQKNSQQVNTNVEPRNSIQKIVVNKQPNAKSQISISQKPITPQTKKLIAQTQNTVSPTQGSISTNLGKINIQSGPDLVKIPQNNITQNKSDTEPFYSYSLTSNNLVSRLNFISDPSLIPFLTASSRQEFDQSKLDLIIKFIIRKVPIVSQFKVILISQIRYAIRVVIQMNTDQKLFEAVVSYVYQNGDKSTAELQLLNWRLIQTIQDADPDAFTKYYTVQPENAGKFLGNLIVSLFEKQQTIRNYNKLVKIQKKTTFDGVYFRILLDSSKNIRYQIILFWVPENNYSQILKYELVQHGYDSKKQKVITNDLPNDKYLRAAKQFIVNNFAQKLANTTISFFAIQQESDLKYFRNAFSGLTGRYETIVAVEIDTLSPILVRWEKLEDGYIGLKMEQFSNDPYFQKLTQFCHGYVKSKLLEEYRPDNFQFKIIPGLTKYYRFIFSKPFPFFLTIDQKEYNDKFQVRGIQRVMIVPTSFYYNDRLFSGFHELNIRQIKYDEAYNSFFSFLLVSTKQITQTNHQILAAFKKLTPLGLSYKVIYKILGRQKMYLVNFFNDNIQNQYKVISIEQYIRQIEQGDYKFKCRNLNSKNGVCQQCENNNQYILTAGRCYSRFIGCSLQLASTCIICSSGYLRMNGGCERSPNKAIQEVKTTSTSSLQVKQKIVTITGINTVVYKQADNRNSVCLRYNGPVCTLCDYRFYLHNGLCKKVDDRCNIYNPSTGECEKDNQIYSQYNNGQQVKVLSVGSTNYRNKY